MKLSFQGTGSGAAGGFLVPTSFGSRKLLDRALAIAGLVVLLLGGMWASGFRLHLSGSARPDLLPLTSRGAAESYLMAFHPPRFAVDPSTNLTRNNTSAYCQSRTGNFVCRVMLNGQAAAATVTPDGVVTYTP